MPRARTGEGWAGLGAAVTEPDQIPTLPSVRINNYLNFFHLRRDSNTGKHGKGKDIDPAQLLPTPPDCSPPAHPLSPGHLASPPPGLSTGCELTGPHSDIRETSETFCSARRVLSPQQSNPSSWCPQEDSTSAHPKTGQAWASLVNPYLLEQPSSYPL